jgi:hypothetical protein
MATKQNEFRAPLGTARAGRLVFTRGAYRVSIRADGETGELYRASFEGTVPMVFADDGKITVEYPRFSPSGLIRPFGRAADVTLNAGVPWELSFAGGVSQLRGDLQELALSSFEIRGGASEVELYLPEPQGVVPVQVSGGASKLTLRRPAGAAVRVRIQRGVSKLVVDDQRFGAIGAETWLGSAGSEQASDRYELEIGGGASELTVAEAPESNR